MCPSFVLQPGNGDTASSRAVFKGEQPRALGPGGVRPDMFLTDPISASADTWDQSWQAIGDPERDAFEALLRIYALFGLDVTTNPDVEDDRIPEQRIRQT